MTKKELALKFWEDGYNVGYVATNDYTACKDIGEEIIALKKINLDSPKWEKLNHTAHSYEEYLDALSKKNNKFYIYNAYDCDYELLVDYTSLDIIIIDDYDVEEKEKE